MTAEEIINKNGFNFESFKFDNEYSAKNILKAMEQYRNEGLREELIKFLSYYHFTINDEQKHGFLTTVVDEYLSNKQKP